MTKEVVCVMRATSALMLCVSMILGSLILATPNASAQVDDAVFNGTVTIDGLPAPATLVMYSVGSDGPPLGNSTVTEMTGDYEIWVEGGETYTLYFANGSAMFDDNAMIEQYIDSGETVTVDTDLTPAPATTALMKGYVLNASDPADEIADCTVLGMRMTMSGEMPDYINWTVTDSFGYYELELLPGMLVGAALGTPEYYPQMPGPSSTPITLDDGDTGWYNISLMPYGSETVNITGTVTDYVSTDPVAGAEVSANLEDSMTFANTTDALGEYLIKMFDGSGEIQVEAEGYVPQKERDVTFSGDMVVDWELLAVNAAVEGYVYDARSLKVIEDARVGASSWLGSMDPAWDNREMFNDSETDAAGYYSFEVCSGNWRVYAEAEGYGYSDEDVTVLSGETMQVDLYLYPKSSVIKGYVNDSSTDLPIQGAAVRIETDEGEEGYNVTDDSGYYEVWCMPGDYQVMYIAMGYMWEMQTEAITSIGPDEVLWMNHSLDPATTEMTGAVTDALDDSLLDGAEIQIASFSSTPDFFRVVMTTSDAGSYSVMVAPDPDSIVSADLPGYERYMAFTEVPDVPVHNYDIQMIPELVTQNYTLKGYANASDTDNPIPSIYVYASHGFGTVNETGTNATGYYEFELPCMDLTVTAMSTWMSAGYLPAEAFVPSGAPGSSVWLNFSMDPHSTPPVVTASVVPDQNVSLLNPAEMSATVTEEYLGYISLSLLVVVDEDDFTAYTVSIDSFYFDPRMPLWSSMDATEVSPGVWETEVINWDTEISDEQAVLRDSEGQVLYLNEYWTEMDGTSHVVGEYDNDTLPAHVSCEAVFDPSGALVSIDIGEGMVDISDVSDPTSVFSKEDTLGRVNKATGAWEGDEDRSYVQLDLLTMSFDWLTQAESGSYYAFFSSQDLAQIWDGETVGFTVDNDPPVAVAMDDVDVIANVTQTLDASESTDNTGIVTYMWEFSDGPDDLVLYGITADYTFEYLGDHTVTLTVSDNAGYDSSDTVIVTVVADAVPVADAGPDQEVDEDTLVDFDGSGWDDDLGVVGWTWIIPALSEVMYGETPSYTFAEPGVYTVELIVRDTIGQDSDPDLMVVTVLDVTAPTADAGEDPTDIYVGDEVMLDASASTDNAGIVNYTWTFTDVDDVTLYGVVADYTFENEGEFTVTLEVTDAAGLSDTDEVVVRVTLANEGPDADAGDDIVAQEGDLVEFVGTASSDDVGIESYTWTFEYDDQDQVLTGEFAEFEFEIPGTYIVTLNVTDAEGEWDTDTVIVIVEEKASTFLTEYWWLLAAVAAVVVIGALVLLMKRGKGGPAPAKEEDDGGELEEDDLPPPDEDDI